MSAYDEKVVGRGLAVFAGAKVKARAVWTKARETLRAAREAIKQASGLLLLACVVALGVSFVAVGFDPEVDLSSRPISAFVGLIATLAALFFAVFIYEKARESATKSQDAAQAAADTRTDLSAQLVSAERNLVGQFSTVRNAARDGAFMGAMEATFEGRPWRRREYPDRGSAYFPRETLRRLEERLSARGIERIVSIEALTERRYLVRFVDESGSVDAVIV